LEAQDIVREPFAAPILEEVISVTTTPQPKKIHNKQKEGKECR
jgi:hypothetical protein